MIKKLLTGLLVWLPILFGCFSNASYSVAPIWTLVWSDYQKSVLVKWNVATTYEWITKMVFAPSNSVMFFWDNLWNPVLKVPDWYDCKTKIQYTNYYICDEIYNSSFSDSNCTKQVIDNTFLNNFLGTIGSSDYWAYEYNTTSNTYYKFNLCFSSSNRWQSVCFKFQANQWANMWCYVWSDMTWWTISYNFNTIPWSIIWNTPAVSSNYTPFTWVDYDITLNLLTNRDVILWCEKVWLDLSYCKWWFNSDVLFPDSWFPSLANYQIWQWVDIITMYNMYSWSYNTPNKFMQAISKGWNIHDYDWFRWKPLALYMFATQYFPDSENLQFSFMDIYNYCSLFYDLDSWLHWNNYYTYDNLQVCKNQARIDKIINFWDWYTTDWTGALSVFWDWTWFTTPDEFFWKIYSFFNTNLIYDWESYPWVLPPVIYFFMIAIIFIRIISRSNG